jgi:thioredoxin 1
MVEWLPSVQIESLSPGDMMSEIQYVTEDDFQSEVLEATQPVLVDSTAVWCGPCKMLEPVVIELADEWADKVKVVKLDVDQNASVAMRYQVMGVPTLMLFNQGVVKERMTGFKPKKQIVSKLSPHI